MTLLEMKNLLMIQTGNDVEDYADFSEQSLHYLNQGYARAHRHWMGVEPKTLLAVDTDTPEVPAQLHPAIVDWATWLLYRNGNISKQSRGLVFKDAAERALALVARNGGMTPSDRAAAARFTGLYNS